MNILITGASGFVGQNLVENLKNIKDGKNSTRPLLKIDQIFTYDRDNTVDELDKWCEQADFVFHLAGVNRPADPKEFWTGNVDISALLLKTLAKHRNKCPVMLASSIQASLAGRFTDSEYGRSKRDAETLFFNYSRETNVPVYVYRFPNLAGKWIQPNYNSAIATFCHNIAHDLPIYVSDPAIELVILFIDDLVEAMLDVLEGHPLRADYPASGETVNGVNYDGLTPYPNPDGVYCYVQRTYNATLGDIVHWLEIFRDQPDTLMMPAIPDGSFEKKLYSMYLSYLPCEKIVFDLPMNRDDRGSFTEILKTSDHGQFSVNISNPGVTKGQHWHNTKWELFIVVYGHALIQERRIDSHDVLEFEVSGEHIRAVHMLPGYTHNIINLSETDPLVTLMWANEVFDHAHPDTFHEEV